MRPDRPPRRGALIAALAVGLVLLWALAWAVADAPTCARGRGAPEWLPCLAPASGQPAAPSP